jgi:FkbM family methyltransferase
MYGRGTYQLDKVLAGVEQCHRFGVAVDVGANVGLWTRILCHHFTKVIAIEPIPENVDCLMRNTSDCDNVTINAVAVSQKVGYLPLAYMDDVASASVCSDFESADAHVYCKPLDDFGLCNVDFIKVDVEGFENNVIKSGEFTIRTQRPIVIVEQKKRTVKYDGHKFAAVQTLCSWGMDVAWEKAGDYCLVWN